MKILCSKWAFQHFCVGIFDISTFVTIISRHRDSSSAFCDRCYRVALAWSVCPSVALVHPAKTVRRNEMPFGRDTRVVPSNIVLDRGPRTPQEGDIRGIGLESESSVKICTENCGANRYG